MQYPVIPKSPNETSAPAALNVDARAIDREAAAAAGPAPVIDEQAIHEETLQSMVAEAENSGDEELYIEQHEVQDVINNLQNQRNTMADRNAVLEARIKSLLRVIASQQTELDELRATTAKTVKEPDTAE